MIETSGAHPLDTLPAEVVRILKHLTDAEIFEQFVHKNFVNAKRFSCEGAESMIATLDLLIDYAAGHGIEEIVLGMAHRGRLNVLANIMGKNVREIFAAFRDSLPEDDRMLLVLRVDKQMSWNDLARVMHTDESDPFDDDALQREAAWLRKRFQLVKERLLEMKKSLEEAH